MAGKTGAVMSFLPIRCENVSSDGPCTSFSAACMLGNFLYLHGGVSEARSTHPCSNIHKYCPISLRWEQLENRSGPSLSHHACLPLGPKHIVFIGGWNGKQRTADVYIFDCEENIWLECETTGFPVGAGLSSHTANLLCNGEILVIGREGSLRMQRRSGNAFLLSGSVAKRKFVYREYPLAVASRSGHTTTNLKGSVVIVGGRSDHLLEVHKIPQVLSTTMSTNSSFSSIPVLPKPPTGRKNHSATTVGSCIVIYGGETFDGRSKEPVSELYVIDTSQSFTWKSVGKTSLGRAGHVAVIYDNNILIHGGVGQRNIVSDLTFELKIGCNRDT